MSDDSVTIEVNGVPMEARKGQMLIEVTDRERVHVPRFCYHRKLEVAANCRMCLVEVEKAPKPLPACATPVADGMKVFTGSPLALKAQKAVMEFLLINHPLDCPICDQGGECELQDLAMGYGRDVSRFQERKRVVKDKNIGPLIQTDMTRCIHCTRCVRFGEEIGGLQELGATGRSEHMEIGTYVERSVKSELSGNVIDLCPVGALTSKPFRFRARAWEMQQREGIAPHDGVGSNVHVHLAFKRVMRVVPRDNEAVNETWLSDRDRFSYQGLYSEDRLQAPMIRRDGRWQSTDWDTALQAAAEGLRTALAEHGGQGLGVLASPAATLEEHYLLQRLARDLGCSNVDHRLRQADFSDQEQAPRYPSLGQAIAALEDADVVLLIGGWTRKEQPLINHRLRKAALKGARVLLLNPLDYEFNFPVAGRLIAGPGRMVAELAGLARALLEAGGGADAELERLLGDVAAEERHAELAAQLANAGRTAVLLGSSALAHPRAAALRALGARIAGLAGGTLGELADGPNAAGAWLAGAVPHRGAGGRELAQPGLHAGAMIERGLPAWVLFGIEPELDCRDGRAARAALDAAGFVLCFTAYRTPAMEEYADLLLPIAQFAENTGTYVNAEGRWQGFSGVAPAPGETRPAWKLLRVLGNRLGLEGYDYDEAEAVTAEVRAAAGAEGGPGEAHRPLPATLPAAPEGGLWRIGDVPPYALDPLVRRAAALQQTADADVGGARMNARLAQRLGVEEGARLRVSQDGASAILEVVLDAAVPDDCVRVAAGIPQSAGLGPAFGPIEAERA